MTSATLPSRVFVSSRRTNRGTLFTRIVTTAIAAVVCVVTLVALAPAASAVPVTGRAFGYFSPEGGGFWLGSWQLGDGTLAFCVNTERSTPNGEEFSYADGAALGWYSADDAARLAYLSRTWATTTDPTTAAAGQIATWTITGLGRHSQEELAAKAGAQAGAVLDLARKMLDETEKWASRTTQATLEFSQTEENTVRVTPLLRVDSLASGWVLAPAGKHPGTVTLTGATFTDGTTSTTVRNGESVTVRVPSASAVAEVSGSVQFDGLSYGNAITMAVAQGGAQNLLTARAAAPGATASVSTALASERPFQPVVSTRTSAAVADDGASVFDTVVVDVQQTPSTLSEWPVYGPPRGPFSLVPVTIRSRLLGPFQEVIVPSTAAPPDAPVVCEVSLVVTTGPGEYDTPSCTLAGPGHYVWVETISPSDTTPTEGRGRILPWTSPFGVTTEITTVNLPSAPAAPPVPAEVPEVVHPPMAPMLPETGSSATGRATLTVLALALFLSGVACLLSGDPRVGARRQA